MSTREDGAVTVLIAISLVALMALVALAIDLSVAFNWRRADQNGADHAALAAAWASCQGQDPGAAGLQAARDNGFNNDGVSNSVSITNVGTSTFEAKIDSSVDSLFAGVIGVDRLDATARAVASCSRSSAGAYAIFAASAVCGEKTLDWSGSSSDVVGRVHSNDGVYVGGTRNSVDGATTYVSGAHVNPGNDLNPPPAVSPVLPMPIEFDIDDFAPGGAKAAQAGANYHYAGGSKIDKGWLESRGLYDDTTGDVAPGLYFTTSDIDLSASDLNGRATFVSSNGTISLNGSNHDFTPWDPDGLLLFSDRDTSCFDYAVKVDGSNSDWRGLIYAPRGMIEMSGSGNASVGSVVADTVRLNGSILFIDADEDCCAGPPALNLLE